MDAANRWETEAMRESRDRRSRRPAVSQDRDATPPGDKWRTLRDASDLTGIPIGTLRKWCRRDAVDSYLESDGELTLRMVEMGSVRERAESLHGKDAGRAASQEEEATSYQLPATSPREEVAGRQTPDASPKEDAGDMSPERETMIVPVDAWNKMLNQLGNLHEAGQQLAEARERAAKAETEALFLRERLAEMREEVASRQSPVARPEEEAEEAASYQLPATSTEEVASRRSPAASSEEADGERDEAATAGAAETVSFWRYVARGWKGRRR